MIVEMGCLILGVPVGFLLRRKPLVIKITDQVLTWSVRILLLLLGLALGADDRLMVADGHHRRARHLHQPVLRGGEPHRRAPPRAGSMNRHVGATPFPVPRRTKGRHSEGIHSSPVLFQLRRARGRLDLLPADWLGLVHEAQQSRRIRHARRRGHEPRFDSGLGASCGTLKAGSCSSP